VDQDPDLTSPRPQDGIKARFSETLGKSLGTVASANGFNTPNVL